MGYRQIYIREARKLSFELSNLIVDKNDESKLSFNLEDISFILLEDCACILTGRLLSELSKRNISLIVCDEKHMPCAITYPHHGHHKQLEVFNLQLDLSKVTKGELWKQLIAGKLYNQTQVIRLTSRDENAIEIISNYEVRHNDEDNREGIAAKVYFNSLYGCSFIRSADNALNSALDYGYTILHGEITRVLCSYGFNTYLGIWHDSKVNHFNLASDLIEPFRAIVDYYLYWHLDDIVYPLSIKTRKELVNILNAKVLVKDKKCNLKYAIEQMVISLVGVLNGQKMELAIPQIISIDFDNYE